jgi:hypothetical protein
VAEIAYKDLERRLTPDARKLFSEMVEAHLAAKGDRFFVRADTMGGTGLIFAARGIHRDWHDFDGSALEDLVGYNLLHLSFGGRGSPNYRISGEGLLFHQWLMEEQGAAISQVEDQVQRVLAGDAFAKAHPGAAHHLAEAFSLLWSGTESNQVISEIGDHLRKALMDMTTDILGSEIAPQQEQPVERLRKWLATAQSLSPRDLDVVTQLVELARAVLRLDHRLNHVRDEISKKQPPPSPDEVRRAAFTTAYVCYELERVNTIG